MIVVRPVEAGELAELAELAQRTWADAFGEPLSPEELAGELEETRSEAYFAEAIRRDTILVAAEEGRLLGYVQLGGVDIPEVQTEPGDRALRRLYVDASARRRGIGRQLADAALRDPALAHARRVYLQVWEQNEPAVGLYETLGFRVVGKTSFAFGGETVEDLVMLLER